MQLNYHLKELKYRLLYLSLSLILCWMIFYSHKFFLLNLFFSLSYIDININMIFTHVSEALISYIYFTLFLAILYFFPNLCYHIYEFMKPGLYQHESKKWKKYLKSILIICYSFIIINWYLLLPYFTNLLLYNNIHPNLTFSPKISEFVSFLILFTFCILLLLILPLLFIIIIPPLTFSKYRFQIYFILSICLSIITPPDLLLLISSLIFIIGFIELLLLLFTLHSKLLE